MRSNRAIKSKIILVAKCLFAIAIVAISISLGFALPTVQRKAILLATTTSTQDSGLLDVLLPIFEARTGYKVKTIAVGSGQAMALGKRGEVDVLLIHSPEEERKFTAEAYGINRKLVMYNEFVVVGPSEDIAQVRLHKDAVEAFRKIANAGAIFISRGDNSGTHLKEESIWRTAGVNLKGQRWYQQTGLGMGQTLTICSEKQAYTLSDRGTFEAIRKNLKLEILMGGGPELLNLYHIIEVNPARWKRLNYTGARAFSDFMTSIEVQDIINNFGKDKFGRQLFIPAAGKTEMLLGVR